MSDYDNTQQCQLAQVCDKAVHATAETVLAVWISAKDNVRKHKRNYNSYTSEDYSSLVDATSQWPKPSREHIVHSNVRYFTLAL